LASLVTKSEAAVSESRTIAIKSAQFYDIYGSTL